MKPNRSRRRLQPETVLLIRQILIGTMVFSFFGLLLSTIWFGTRVDALTIDTITVSGGETIDHATVETKLWQALEGSYLGFIPRVFALTYPETALYDSAKSIDRIKDISITRVGGTELQVTFSEYEPHALWCRSENEERCLFLDESGYAFGGAPELQGGSLLRVVAIGRDPEVRTQAFPPETYERVHDLVAALAGVNWFVDRVDIDSANDAFMRLVGGGEFKVTLATPTDVTLNNLQTVLASADFSDLAPGSFQYIDLRFGSKVFVNENLAVGETATVTESTTSVAESESGESANGDALATEESPVMTATLATPEPESEAAPAPLETASTPVQ